MHRFKSTWTPNRLFFYVAFALVFSIGILFSVYEYKRAVTEPPENPLYLNRDIPIDTRVADLLSYMTLEEKIGQMTLVEKNSIRKEDDVATYGIGALLSGFGGKPDNNTYAGWNAMVSDFIEISKDSRLGIPVLYGVDAIHGHSNVPGATVFPHFIGLGATGDAVLVEHVARATAEELVATNVRWSFSPTLDMPRDIRWGRTYETFSDDPKLVGRLGKAYINGLQKFDTTSSGTSVFVMSTPKHFIGAGGMTWGSSSNINFKIDQGITPPVEALLRQEYLPPFIEAIDTGAVSIMVGLNSWGDTKLSADKYLLTDVLKGELGFKGFTVSDWYGVYEISGSQYSAAVTAINAGIDMVMLPFDYKPFVKNVLRAVHTGDISEERIDDAVRRILRAKFALGLFDTNTYEVHSTVVGSVPHRALARDAVAKSLVLLKNEKSVLPITSTSKFIRVVGSAADNIGRQTGAWTVEWQGIEGNWLEGATSILKGIRERAGDSTRIAYEAFGNFNDDEGIADIGIAIVGEQPYAEGWGDTAYPMLSIEDREAIKKLQMVSKKVVVIIVSGRPLFITHEIPTWDAVVVAWLPGSEGAGVADVLFGDKAFTGTLPLPWPHHAEQLPITQNGSTVDKTPLLFPRFFGIQ